MDDTVEELKYMDRCSPPFYEGMTVIEPIVRYHLDPTKENKDVLFYWYLSSLQNYWIKSKRVLLNPTDQEKELSLRRRYDLQIEASTPAIYTSRFYGLNIQDEVHLFKLDQEEHFKVLSDKLNAIKDTYNTFLKKIEQERDSDILPKEAIFGAYYFLSLIFCLDPVLLLTKHNLYDVSNHMAFGDSSKRKINYKGQLKRIYLEDLHSIYPLCNDVGVFAIGSYLFAYGNGVDLFGIPSQISSFDMNTDCSTEFLNHEMQHYYDMTVIKDFSGQAYEKEDAHYFVKEQHLQILKDDNLSPGLREIILLGLWYLLHEMSVLPSENDGDFDTLLSGDVTFLDEPRNTSLYDDFQTPYYTEATKSYVSNIKDWHSDAYQRLNDIPSDMDIDDTMMVPVMIYLHYFFENVIQRDEEDYEDEEE